MGNEDADIRAAINAVASYASQKHKRTLVREMTEAVNLEVAEARMAGKPIDVSRLFLALAERYVD